MSKYTLYFLLFCLSLFFSPCVEAQNPNLVQTWDTLELETWEVDFVESETKGELQILIESEKKSEDFIARFQLQGEDIYMAFRGGKAVHNYQASYEGALLKLQHSYRKNQAIKKKTELWHLRLRSDGSLRKQAMPLYYSLLPPLIAILLALLSKQVLLALFMGILSGAWLTAGMPFEPYFLFKAIVSVLDTYLLGALSKSDHLSVLLFSLLIGALVALISRNGGMAGIVERLAPLARGPKSTQFVTWLLGIAIFFDDYANSLIVGNTMRPVSDKHNISREKLAYIVDSTAAPVASIAFITTWIGAELGYIGGALGEMEGLTQELGAYSVFLSSLSYSFYAYFTLVFIVMLIASGRDFGPMHKAEQRAFRGEEAKAHANTESEELEDLEPVEGAPRRWLNGFLPVLVVVFGTLWGLIDTGMAASYGAIIGQGKALANADWATVWASLGALDAEGEPGVLRKLGILIGNADSYKALLWSSLLAVLLAVVLSVSQGILKLSESIDTLVRGFKTMMPALLILLFAWALAALTKELATAEFLTLALGDNFSPYWLPVLVFILSAFIAFSTGSSWSTMAILYPIAIPLTWTLARNAGLAEPEALELVYNVIAIVLSASVLGDHCSPISDTTILSSLASGCNHIEHVNTQMPYALFVGAVSVFMAYFSTAVGLGFFVNFVLGLLVLYGGIRVLGRETRA